VPLQASLLDEIVLHIAPLLLGGGVRLFGDEADGPAGAVGTSGRSDNGAALLSAAVAREPPC